MSRQSLAAFRQTITVAWPKTAAAEAKAHLLRVARAGDAEIRRAAAARAGYPPDVTAFANRPGNPNLDAVTLPGPIVYLYDYRREIVDVALGALLKASPVESGRYAMSHMLFVNDQPVEALPSRLDESDEIMIANPLPYARRLEIGKTKSGRDFVLRVPNRIYERVAKSVLIPRYRNLADIVFTYVTLPDAYVVKGKLPARYGINETRRSRSTLGEAGTGKSRKRNQKPGEPIRAPAIFIRAASRVRPV
ncbi:MAG: hypothetical protein ACK4NA_12835 [Alphaproteobacteria bacterium]